MNILFIRTAYSAVPLLRSWGQHSDPAVETLKNPTLDGRLTMYHKVVYLTVGDRTAMLSSRIPLY